MRDRQMLSVMSYNQGSNFCDQGELDKAIDCYTRAISLNPNYANAYNNRGLTYYKQGNLEEAIKDFKKAIELNSKEAHNNLGMLYYKQGNSGEALKYLSKVIELDPTYATAYYNRAMVYYDQNMFFEMKSDFSRICDLDGDLSLAVINKKSLNWGDTGLHIAVRICDEKLAAMLLRRKIDQSIKNQQGVTALELACQLGYGDMMSQLGYIAHSPYDTQVTICTNQQQPTYRIANPVGNLEISESEIVVYVPSQTLTLFAESQSRHQPNKFASNSEVYIYTPPTI